LFFYRVLGALERGEGGRLVLAKAETTLVACGATLPAESQADVDGSLLLEKVQRRKVAVFADGAPAWKAGCQRRGIRHHQVVHSRMEFVRRVQQRKLFKAESREAGTQALDATWRGLKAYIPATVPAIRNGVANDLIWTYACSFQWRRNAKRAGKAQCKNHETQNILAYS
jgi:hypothetical protein